MVLRIEDTDLKRSTTAHDASIINDLAWLGLRADEGPDVGGPYGPYRQSERAALYEAGVQQLLADGHAYPCFCPQELLEQRKEQQLAGGRCPSTIEPAAICPPTRWTRGLRRGRRRPSVSGYLRAMCHSTT